MTVIDRIEEKRELKKIDKKLLAESIGMSAEQYGRITKKTKDIKVSTLIKIAEFLKVHPCVFFKDESNPSAINGNYNNIGNGNGNSVIINNLEKEVENLKERIADKDKMIADKDKIIELLSKNQ